jgi:hypothetical protein
MFCHNKFDPLFLSQNLNKTWHLNDYKKHREIVLVDRQIAQLPETQEKAIKVKENRKLTTENKELKLLKQSLKQQINNINSKIKENENKAAELFTKHNDNAKGKNFSYKCPSSECNGFLDCQWTCGICEVKFCKNCMEELSEDHECDKEKVETIKFIRKDTKPCPGCGEMIHKIHGCDQMWCVYCKVAFSWRTGEFEKGTLHNPEYYRWMRENNEEIPQANPDVQCGQLPNALFILTNLRFIYNSNNTKGHDDIKIHIVLNAHRLVEHINATERYYNHKQALLERNLEELRIKFLLKEITKDAWKIKLQAIEKSSKKETDTMNIWRFMRDLITPIIWYIAEQFHEPDFEKLYNTNHSVKNRLDKEALEKLEKLRNFANSSFERISYSYNNDSSFITESYSNVSLYYSKRKK